MSRNRRLRLGLMLGVVLGAVATTVPWRGGRLESARAQVATTGGNDSASRMSLAYIPRDALLVFGARPAALAAKPALSPVLAKLESSARDELVLGFAPQEVTEIVSCALVGDKLSYVTVIRLDKESALTKFWTSTTGGFAEGSFDGTPFRRSPQGVCFVALDGRTLLTASDEPSLRRSLVAGPGGASTSKWSGPWNTMSRSDAVCVVNTSLLSSWEGNPVQLLGAGGPRRGPFSPASAMRWMPLWQNTESAIAELRVTDQIDLRIICQSATVEDATRVHSAAHAGLAAVRMGLSLVRDSIARQPALIDAVLLKNIDLVDALVEQAQVARRETQVAAAVSADASTTSKLLAMVAPALGAAQSSASRVNSQNNLRQLALAFHNYHDVFKTFPAAVQKGPKNIPHSWRITILPFLSVDRQATSGAKLYEEYRQDEPWDSPHNIQLLPKMPAVFRAPSDQGGSTNTSYFAFTGQATPLGKETRNSIANIIDGTSFTILLVESKRATPWLKPEEIPFEPEGELPQIGGWHPGGFHAAMCDGRVIFLPDSLDREQLRYLIMPQDGQRVILPER